MANNTSVKLALKDLATVDKLRETFGTIYDENSRVLPGKQKDSEAFLNRVYSPEIGIPENFSIKQIGITLEDLHETLSETPENEAPIVTGAPENSESTIVEPEKPFVSRRLTPDELREFQEAAAKETKRRAGIEQSAEGVRSAIKRKQEIHAEQIRKSEAANATPEKEEKYEKVQEEAAQTQESPVTAETEEIRRKTEPAGPETTAAAVEEQASDVQTARTATEVPGPVTARAEGNIKTAEPETIAVTVEKQKTIYKEQIAKEETAGEVLSGQVIYYKVNLPFIKEAPEVKELRKQAEADPKKFVEDTIREYKKRAATLAVEQKLTPEETDVVVKQAALTTYEVLTDNSPIIAARINRVVSDPEVLKRVAPDPQTQEALKTASLEIFDQKVTQFELAKQFADPSKIDGLKNLEDVRIEISYTKEPGFEKFDIKENIISPHVDSLSGQSELLDSLKDLGESKGEEIKSKMLLKAGAWLDGQIAKLPAGSALAKFYNSELVQLGLSYLGIAEGASWVAAEGSWLGRAIISSGYGNVAGFIQAKTGIDFGLKLAAKTAVETGTKAAGQAASKVAGKAVTQLLSKAIAALGTLASWATLGLSLLVGYVLGKIAEKIDWKKVKKVSIAIFGGAWAATYGRLIVRRTARFFGRLLGDFLKTVFNPLLIIILVFPVLVAITLFIINSGAYIVPPSPAAALLGQDNPYISVTKTANPDKIANPSGNQTVTYTVTIAALRGILSNLKILSTSCNVNKKDKSNVDCPIENVPGLPADLSVSPGSPYSFTFSADFGPNLSDSLVSDSIKISADTVEKKDISTSGSETVCVGECSTSCIKVVDNADPWPGNLRSNVESAATGVSSTYPSFAAKVCGAGVVNVCYDPAQIDQGSYAWHKHSSECDVVFNEKGVSTEQNATFLLTHEVTHHVQVINPVTVVEYLNSGAFAELGGRGICSYSRTASDWYEAMAEAAGLYAKIPSWGGCVSNYQSQYPKNYTWARGFME